MTGTTRVIQTSDNWFSTALLALPLLLLASCGGGGSSASPGASAVAANVSGQALLGPLSGAEVEIIDLSSGNLVYSTQAASSNILAEAGSFSIPLNTLADQTLYLVRASGGLDIDADDNGELDPVATVNNGKIHLILIGQRLKQGGFRVSLLSELVYRRLAHLLRAGTDPNELLAEIERRVALILRRDIDGDGDRDSNDMAIWHPQFNGADIRNGLAAYQQVISGIHDNDSNPSFELATADVLLGTAASGRAPSAIIQGGIAYLADGALGLSIVDMNQAGTPVLRASLDTPGLALGVAVYGNIAYVADANSGLQVISVGDPTNPTVLSQLATNGEVRGVVVANGVIYALDSADGLLVLDTSNPGQPRVASTIPVEGEPLGISIEPQYPNRLLVPTRQSDGEELDLVFMVESSGVILEGTLGPDPNNPALETILVRNPGTGGTGGIQREDAAPVVQ